MGEKKLRRHTETGYGGLKLSVGHGLLRTLIVDEAHQSPRTIMANWQMSQYGSKLMSGRQ